MADPIAAMLGLEIDDEAKTRALADSLRGRKQAADFFSISTVDPIAQGAQAEQATVLDSAERGGALRKGLEDRRAQDARALADREAMNTRQTEKLAHETTQAELDRQAKLNEAQTLSGFGLKPTASSLTDYRNQGSLLSQIGGLKDTSKMTEAQIAELDQPGMDVALSVMSEMVGDDITRYADQNLVHKDPGVRDWMARAARVESMLTKLNSGLAVTQFELKDKKNWSPMAPGIDFATRQKRLQAIEDVLREDNRQLYGLHKGYLEQPGWMTRDAIAEEKEATAAQNLQEGKTPEGEEIDVYTTDVDTLMGMVKGVPIEQLTPMQKEARLELLRRHKQAQQEERESMLQGARGEAMGPGGRVMP